MEYKVEDYLQGKAPKGLDGETVNNNFVEILCKFKALMDVLDLRPEQRQSVERLSESYFQEAVSKMNQVRKSE